MKNYVVYQFVNNFSALLLCKINFLDFYDTSDFFQILVISRNTKILIDPIYWLRIHVPYILNRFFKFLHSPCNINRCNNNLNNHEVLIKKIGEKRFLWERQCSGMEKVVRKKNLDNMTLKNFRKIETMEKREYKYDGTS